MDKDRAAKKKALAASFAQWVDEQTKGEDVRREKQKKEWLEKQAAELAEWKVEAALADQATREREEAATATALAAWVDKQKAELEGSKAKIARECAAELKAWEQSQSSSLAKQKADEAIVRKSLPLLLTFLHKKCLMCVSTIHNQLMYTYEKNGYMPPPFSNRTKSAHSGK